MSTPVSTFRVHLSGGAKQEVTAPTPKAASQIAVKRHPNCNILKIKRVKP